MQINDGLMAVVFTGMILYILMVLGIAVYTVLIGLVNKNERKKKEKLESILLEKIKNKYISDKVIEIEEVKIFIRSISEEIYKRKVNYKDSDITEILENLYSFTFSTALKNNNTSFLEDDMKEFQVAIKNLITHGVEISPYINLSKRERILMEDIQNLMGDNITEAIKSKLVDLSIAIEDKEKGKSKKINFTIL
ncbi:MAG: hypothetical protein M3Z89_16430 [Lysinibacillus fusiformis]|nr:hypothetical protein [Staphylococcus epidermidis]MCT6929632.1 hypothetical protein [Lysinibacillus fusiformis]MCT6934027.1 hypothetical protein [Lysinibacillus fusiformis]